MFCPFCGIKNGDVQTCFVCEKKLPSLEMDPPPQTNGRPRPARPREKPPAPPARFRDRLLATLLDLLLVSAVLFVAGTALWSRVQVVRSVSMAIVIACASSAALLVMFGYSWLLEDATLGKAFAGIRVIRREQPVSVAARVGIIVLWIAAVGGAIWGAIAICPQCF